MTALLIGATGRTGRFIAAKLGSAQTPFRVLIRNVQEEPFFRRLGAEVLVQDLNADFHAALAGIDTVIYAAGSSEAEGAEQEQQIDRDAVIRMTDYAGQQGVRRLIVISALVATDPSHAPAVMQHYVEMKRQADDYVIGSGLGYVILRPGPLTLEPGNGTIKVTDDPSDREPVSREDVAELAVEALQSGIRKRIIGFVGGSTPISEVIAKGTA